MFHMWLCLKSFVVKFFRPLSYLQFYCQSYHQLHITNCICCFLNYSFWNSFQCICSRFFSMIRKFLALFTTSVFTYTFTYFYPYFQQNTKIHNLSQIYDLWVQLNVLFFKCYTAVNNWSYIGGFEPCSANHTSM